MSLNADCKNAYNLVLSYTFKLSKQLRNLQDLVLGGSSSSEAKEKSVNFLFFLLIFFLN